MEAEFIGVFNITGGEPCEKERMYFSPDPDARRTVKVYRGDTVYGYVTGGEAAVLMQFIKQGMRLYCLRGNAEEKEKGVQYTVKAYYTPDKI
ncbi:MAG: hypothetical protein J5760_05740 [Clostridia bacterium]|nr:hypothetical protein [Clostridia bacterium]